MPKRTALAKINPLTIMAVKNALKSDFLFTGNPTKYYVELSLNPYS